MERKKIIICCLIFLLIYWPACEGEKESDFSTVSGPYFGQQPPGITAELFAPDIISTGMGEFSSAFSTDGLEFFTVLSGTPYLVIIQYVQDDGIWRNPKTAPFSGKYRDWDINFSPDGKRLFFNSKRPLSGFGEPKSDPDIWVVDKDKDGHWGDPQNLGAPVNTSFVDGYATAASNGTLYFHSNRGSKTNNTDIYFSRLKNGKYSEPENIGREINSEYPEWDACIAPDESYLIFASLNRPDTYGGSDLYICYRTKNDSWTEAKNMGDGINSPGGEICPTLSPDGKYLFFTSSRNLTNSYSENPISYETKMKILNSSGNGSMDIYWVDARIIENLKQEVIK